MRLERNAAIIAAAIGMAGATASAQVVTYHEGFEAAGWTAGSGVAGTDGWNNYNGSDIVQVASGTNGITSFSGGNHATLTNLSMQNNVFGTPTLGAVGAFTRYGGYSSSFGTGFTTSASIYLDPTSWTNGQGFDYSSAVSNQSGGHLRDFIWHVGMVNGALLVNGSNNSDWSFNAWKLENENGGNNYEVSSAGWYTLQQQFVDDGGTLSVIFSLLNAGGGELFSFTRTTTDDIATTVGGNRYGWFTYANIDGLAIDGVQVAYSVIPLPGAAGMALAGMGLIGLRRRR